MDPTRTMITFRNRQSRFTYRVGGIVFHQGQVLFQMSTIDPDAHFGFLPGGRAEMGESAEETLKREMREELGLEVKVERLLYVMENFFTHESFCHHELNLYFLMSFDSDAFIYQEQGPYMLGEEGGLPMIFDWLPVAQSDQLDVRPEFLKRALREIPSHTTHIVQVLDERV